MRKSFTLIELIFVIVIIGVLSAIAIPKYLHLKENAQISSLVNTLESTVTQTLEAAKIEHDLNNKNFTPNCNYSKLHPETYFCMRDILKLNGKYWFFYFYKWVPWSATDSDYYYYDYNGHQIARISMNEENISYYIVCDFLGTSDSPLVKKCKELYGANAKTYVIKWK
jgi:prepilin-type N-terminal cleavage/methylation domain-containing protein